MLVRPLQLVAVVFALTLTLALAALALFTWLDFARVDTIRTRVTRTQLLQQSAVLLKEAQRQAEKSDAVPRAAIAQIGSTLAQIQLRGAPIGPITRERLAQLDTLLQQAQRTPVASLSSAGAIIDQMLDRETSIQSELLDRVYFNTRLESRSALVALVAFPGMLLAALWAWRQRIFRPIDNLRDFIGRLSNGDFAPVSVTGIDPLLLPLFTSVRLNVEQNQLVIGEWWLGLGCIELQGA